MNLVGLFPAAPAFAALIDLGDVTRDTETGLDWLDVTATQGLAYDEILSGTGGWSDAGWRHATAAEVCELFATLGPVPSPSPGTTYPFSGAGQTHLDPFGMTLRRQQPYSGGTLTLDQLWATLDDLDPGNSSVGLVEVSVDRHRDGWVKTFIGIREKPPGQRQPRRGALAGRA